MLNRSSSSRSTLKLVAPHTALRRVFYCVWPEETQFAAVDDVPEYVDEAVPYFIVLMLLEMAYTAHRNFRVNDTLASLSSGLLLAVSQLFLRSTEFAAYVYVYEHWRVYELRTEGALTCALLFLGIDFLYYWFHRAAHEVNVLWAAHQVHHSSEEYNLSTALRQSVLQKWLNLLFYVPLAFVAPPSFFVAHVHLNFVFQFWVHTRVVRSLGPLEYVFNTPSHHRVHHARNRYAIDKNYAGTLIIWDRLFGTFAAERFDDEDELCYGLVHPIATFDPWSVQTCHFAHMARTLWSTAGFTNKLCVLLAGPGWSPGKPRLGLTDDLPDVRGERRVSFDPKVAPLITGYCVLHFAGALGATLAIADNLHAWSAPLHAVATAHILLTLTTVAWLLERRRSAPFWDAARCALAAAALHFLRAHELIRVTNDLQLAFFWFACGAHAASAAIVLLITLKPVGLQMSSEKRD